MEQDHEDDGEILASVAHLLQEDKPGAILPQLLEILKSSQDATTPFSVVFDAKNILDADSFLGHLLLRAPLRVLEVFSKALVEEETRLSKSHYLPGKPNLHLS
jgi:hypothetical protein